MSIQVMEGLMEDYKETLRKFQDDAQGRMKLVFKEYFEKNPIVKSIVWVQYTPYFNYGGECVFSVGSPTFTNLTKEEIDSGDWGESVPEYGDIDWEGIGEEPEGRFAHQYYTYRHYYNTSHLDKLKMQLTGDDLDPESTISLIKLMNDGSLDDIFRNIFGDHVMIIVTPEGITTEEYVFHD